MKSKIHEYKKKITNTMLLPYRQPSHICQCTIVYPLNAIPSFAINYTNDKATNGKVAHLIENEFVLQQLHRGNTALNSSTLDIKTLAPGIYYLQTEVGSAKFVKQ